MCAARDFGGYVTNDRNYLCEIQFLAFVSLLVFRQGHRFSQCFLPYRFVEHFDIVFKNELLHGQMGWQMEPILLAQVMQRLGLDAKGQPGGNYKSTCTIITAVAMVSLFLLLIIGSQQPFVLFGKYVRRSGLHIMSYPPIYENFEWFCSTHVFHFVPTSFLVHGSLNNVILLRLYYSL